MLTRVSELSAYGEYRVSRAALGFQEVVPKPRTLTRHFINKKSLAVLCIQNNNKRKRPGSMIQPLCFRIQKSREKKTPSSELFLVSIRETTGNDRHRNAKLHLFMCSCLKWHRKRPEVTCHRDQKLQDFHLEWCLKSNLRASNWYLKAAGIWRTFRQWWKYTARCSRQ